MAGAGGSLIVASLIIFGAQIVQKTQQRATENQPSMKPEDISEEEINETKISTKSNGDNVPLSDKMSPCPTIVPLSDKCTPCPTKISMCST